jgi:methylmalonyl-CoA mutase N-terminal domain/subunit
VALQALAAVLGGTQSLHTNSFDEAYALPSQKAATIALRTQQIIGHESGVTSTVDPLGGGYCIEALTKQIEEDSSRYIEEIDRQGGAVKAIVKGYMQREITESAYRFQKSVEEKESIIVGVNQFIGGYETPVETLKVNPSVEKRAVQRLNRVKNERNNQKVKKALENLHLAAGSESTNLMQPILKAVQSYATIGEICNILREIYGEHRPLTIF